MCIIFQSSILLSLIQTQISFLSLPSLPSFLPSFALSFSLSLYTAYNVLFLLHYDIISFLALQPDHLLLWGAAVYIIHENGQSNWRHLEWFNQCGLWHWKWKQKDNSILTLDYGSVSCLWQRTPNRNKPFASEMAVY